MAYRLTWEDGGVHIALYGWVTGGDIKDAGDAVYGHADFDRTRYSIFDFTDATDVTITLDEVKEIGAIDLIASTTNPNLRQAIVSNSETVDIALGFYVANSPDLPWESEGFKTLEEARAWLSEE